ncbi:hypothetical protein PALB_24700 [Pseudoalteromonas luteoviolacea B = ATCC 29581]|nr:hypothetical protein PALB_24700 [Pseudoalteromonas luteoviolacea B = ATCC 29581]
MKYKQTSLIGMSLLLASCGGGGSSETAAIQPTTPVTATGDLTISVSGLPQGSEPSVKISGPNSFSQTLSASQTLTGLNTGQYTIEPMAVDANGVIYDVQPAKYTVSVLQNSTTPLSLQYESPIVSKGVISNFGSVYVNGMRFKTEQASFRDEEGKAIDENQFGVGMLVTVVGRAGASASEGNAQDVYYELKAKGPVESVELAESRIKVVGLSFVITESTEFENTTFETLLTGEFVKVSALQNDENQLIAAHVEKADQEDEIKLAGVISLLDDGAKSFSLNNLVIDYTRANVEGQLSDGAYVIVYAETNAADGVLNVSKVKVVTRDVDDSGVQYAIDGVIQSVMENNQFTLNGLTVMWNDETQFFGGSAKDVAIGERVKIHGALVEEQFIARKIRFDKQGVIKLKGQIEEIDSENLTVMVLGQTLTLDSHTKLKDKSRLKVRRMTMSELAIGDVVEINAFKSTENVLLVKKLTRYNATSSTGNSVTKLEGSISTIADMGFNVQNVAVSTDELTEFELDDESIDRDAFFAKITTGMQVEVKGLVQATRSLLAVEVEAKSKPTGQLSYVKLEGEVQDFVSLENFKVNGRIVKVNEFTRFEDGDAKQIANGVLVEIKGKELEDGSLLAIKIEFEREDEREQVEFKGKITQVDADDTFFIGSKKILINQQTQFEYGSVSDIAVNSYVEVKGIVSHDGLVTALKIEFEKEEVEVKGTVTQVLSETQFLLNDKTVQYSTSTKFEQGNATRIGVGVTVKVKGFYDSERVLIARKIEFEKLEKVEFYGSITALADGLFVVNDKNVKYNDRTEFEQGSKDDLAVGKVVKVKGRIESNNTVIALEVEFKEKQSEALIEVEGKISRFDSVKLFYVGSRAVTTDEQTVFERGTVADLKKNAEIEVKGHLNADNVLVAKTIKFDD